MRTPYIFILSLLAGTSQLLAQGPLAPDSSPDATMKTLQQVEPRIPIESLPFEISTRGSYFLAKDLVLTNESSGSNGIVITASEVVLDLGGFTLTGGSGHAIAIIAPAGQRNITIRNGIMRDWGGNGVNGADDAEVPIEPESLITTTLPAAYSRTGVVVENVTVADCGGVGIALGGSSSVRNCLVYNVPAGGVHVAQGSRIIDCRVYNIGSNGFVAVNGSIITGSQASNCSAPEDDVASGFVVTESVIENCASFNNDGAGFTMTSSNAVNCRAFNNQTSGFVITGGSLSGCSAGSNQLTGFLGTEAFATLTSCTARNNNRGFVLTGGSLQSCTASQNNASGFVLSSITAQGCTSSANDGDGFQLESTQLTESQATANATNGITAGSANLISNCHIADNGGGLEALAAILVSGNGNRIIGNHLTRAPGNSEVGVLVLNTVETTAIQNIVTGNTAVGFAVAYSVDATANLFGGETTGPLSTTGSQSSLLNLAIGQTP